MDSTRSIFDNTDKNSRSNQLSSPNSQTSPNSLIAEHWCNTQVKIIKMRYIWTISNFSFCRDEMGDTVRSSIFSAGPNDKFKWCLRINPKGLDDDSRDYLSLYLLLVNSGAKAEARAKFRFSLLNARKEETKAMESQRAYRFIQGKDWGFKKFIRRDVLVDEVSGLLPNDQLTIACEISVVGETVSECGQINHQPISIPDNNLHEDIGNLFYRQLFTDVTLVVVSANDENDKKSSISCVESTTEGKPNFSDDFSHLDNISPNNKDLDEPNKNFSEDNFGALSISSSINQSIDESDEIERKNNEIKDVRSPSSDVSDSTSSHSQSDHSSLVNSSSNQNVSESQNSHNHRGNPDSNTSRIIQDDNRISHSTDAKINYPGSSILSYAESLSTSPNNNDPSSDEINHSLSQHSNKNNNSNSTNTITNPNNTDESTSTQYDNDAENESSSSSSQQIDPANQGINILAYKYRNMISNSSSDFIQREDNQNCSVMATSTTNNHFDSYNNDSNNINNSNSQITTSSSGDDFNKRETKSQINESNDFIHSQEQPTTSKNSKFLTIRSNNNNDGNNNSNRPRVLRQFQAHKAILAARSPVFAAMFEHSMEESRENRVEISDVDPETMSEVLRYIYTGQVQQLQKLAPELLAAADKYHLDRLKIICEKALVEQLCIENACITLGIADIYNAEQLKKFSMEFIIANAAEVCETEGFEKLTKLCPKLLNQCFRSLANQQAGPIRCPLRKKPRQS